MTVRSLLGAALVFILLQTFSTVAQTPRAKPPVPVGVDPGGVAIGFITTGIDYTLPTVARCLARDGEGRLIAWDVVDRDPLPYRPHGEGTISDNALFVGFACEGRVRIAAVRVDPADPVTISRAIAFLATTPARVVVIPAGTGPADWKPLLAAAEAFRQMLVVVAAANVMDHPAAGRANVTFVTDAVATAASLAPLGHAATLVACNAAARDGSLDGAARAALLTAQIARTTGSGIRIMMLDCR